MEDKKIIDEERTDITENASDDAADNQTIEELLDSLDKPKDLMAKETAKKEINYSAALREKNQKIQEEKDKVAKLEEQLQALEEENNSMLDTDDNTEALKKIKEMEKKLQEQEERYRIREKQAAQEKNKLKIDRIIEALKVKYKDSELPFDETKVIAEVLKKKKGNAVPEDLEDTYRSMLLKKIMDDRHKKEGITEGSSMTNVEPSKSIPKTKEEVIEKWLKRKK